VADFLKVKDCYKYKEPSKLLEKEGGVYAGVAPATKAEVALLTDYVLKAVNDTKNLMKVQQLWIKNIVKELKKNGIIVDFDPFDPEVTNGFENKSTTNKG